MEVMYKEDCNGILFEALPSVLDTCRNQYKVDALKEIREGIRLFQKEGTYKSVKYRVIDDIIIAITFYIKNDVPNFRVEEIK